MAEFVYNGKNIKYHLFNEDRNECIIPLGNPGGDRLALFDFAKVFGSPDEGGKRFKVAWMEYGEESDYDKACETIEMMKDSGTEKSNFALFGRDGANIISEIFRLFPNMVSKVYADEGLMDETEAILKGIEGFPKAEYCYSPDIKDLFTAIRNSLLGWAVRCPYCGRNMQLGFVYGLEPVQAFWTADSAYIGDGPEFDEGNASILPLRDNFKGYDTWGELFTGIPASSVAKGHLCRRCGKMVIDMAPALIHFKDKLYIETNGMPEPAMDEDDKAGENKPPRDAFAVWGNTFRSMFKKGNDEDPGRPDNADELAKRERELEKKYAKQNGEPKRRSFFGRGPKVE